MKCALHWFRRDLRLHDNTALHTALGAAEKVVTVYILSEWKGHHHWTGPARQQFLCESLAVLAENLRKIGGKLIIRQGRADRVLEKLLTETGAEAIYFNRDPDPFGRAMEEKVAAMAKLKGAETHALKDIAIHERDEVMTGQGSAFRVFTPYARAWLKLPKPPTHGAPRAIHTMAGLHTLPLPTLAHWGLAPSAEIITPGEDAARKRLDRFLSGPIRCYGELRNSPSAAGTSRLSQDLRHGLLSPREVYTRCVECKAQAPAAQARSHDIYINELIWRDFYQQVLWHRPDVLETDFSPDHRKVRWREPGPEFTRWCEGQTGFPIVDAAMRQLNATGFMHNRLRMITAMFLTKDLHVYWQAGESYFMQRLADGEIASNNGGWQWSAGTGADAAPYFRIQNPWTQSERFDPEGAFIKQWVPELRDVDARRFGRPPEPGLRLSRNYPEPMVDHARERAAALRMFRQG